MAKKNKSRNKKKTNKAARPAPHHSGQHTESVISDDSYVVSPAHYAPGHLFVDRRNDNSSGIRVHSGGRRQDPHRQLLPLTDRNLQTLLEQSGPTGGSSRYGSLVVDMDQFAREQQQLRGSYGNDNGDSYSAFSHGSDELLLEFGELNPSLDHLSDLTSLDDVCFPDYYEGLMGADSAEIDHVWPDLSVLEEFIAEELEELQDSKPDPSQEVNFQYPVARRVSSIAANDGHNRVLYENILPTNEEAPLLLLVQVDETVLPKLSALSLRVRPKPIQPWEKSREQIPSFLNNGHPIKDALCRFTYFREDIEGTIHTPTLLGLVHDHNEKSDSPKSITQSLEQLFSPSTYGKHSLTREETPVAEGAHDGNGINPLTPSNATTTAGSNLQVNNPVKRNLSQKFSSPLPNASVPSVTGTAPATTVNSVTGNHHHHHHVPPFWLDILDPLEEEMKVLSKTFGLHPLTTEDIYLGETREKVELFRQYYFICFTSFDIVYERRKQRARENEKKSNKLLEYSRSEDSFHGGSNGGFYNYVRRIFLKKSETTGRSSGRISTGSSVLSKNKNVRSGELCPLNMYMIIFKHGVLTFHFSATPHPINVRRRARMLKDHLTVSTDWICYALIDDITDSFAPMIDSIEAEVYLIEDEIMKMHSGDSDDSDSELDQLDAEDDFVKPIKKAPTPDVFYRRQRSKSIVDAPAALQFMRRKRGSRVDYSIDRSRTSRLSSSKSTLSKIVAWKRKGDMLRRIGECRKRVMSVMRLLGSKADVIKGFSKRFNESEPVSNSETPANNARLALRQEILMYLGDIQDHIVTMVQSLNHYEKLLARSHSNYLAQINIDMTKVNNDTNDVLGKITILGTIVLPINVVTGLWGMNCIVPGQDYEGLTWFVGIVLSISLFSVISYIYAKKVTGL